MPHPKSKRPLSEPDLDDRTLFDRASLEIDHLLSTHHYVEAMKLDQLLEEWMEHLDACADEIECESHDADDSTTGIEDYEIDPTEPVQCGYWEPDMVVAVA